eukprot:COSAG02_NODE_969_length_15565_cov_9.614833_15_plen_91_part_00
MVCTRIEHHLSGCPVVILLLYQHLPVFRGLGQEVISELCMLVTSVHLGRGNIVYMEGKFGNEMCPLRSDSIVVQKQIFLKTYCLLCQQFR